MLLDALVLNFEYNKKKSNIVDNAIVTIEYKNGIRANFNLCMFSPMFHEEIIICGDEGRLKAYETDTFLPFTKSKKYLEIMRGEMKPSRIASPAYPRYIEESGHSGSTFYEHKYFIDNIEGKNTGTATPDEGFWSIVIGAAAEKSIKTGKIIHIKELLDEHSINL